MNKNQKSRRNRGFAWMCRSGLLLGAKVLLFSETPKYLEIFLMDSLYFSNKKTHYYQLNLLLPRNV